MIKGIIFDLDDLLVNTCNFHFTAFEKTLQVKIPTALRKKYFGMRIEEIVKDLMKYFGLSGNPQLFVEARNRYFMKLIQEGVEPMPGHEQIIKNVITWGLKRALATSGETEYVEEILEQLNLTNYFDVIVVGNDVVKSKPEPDIFTPKFVL